MTSKYLLSQVGEFGWLKKLLPRLYWPASLNSHLCIGPGDDAGALRLSPNKVIVATTDTLVEGIHFERDWFPPKDLGLKLLAVNLSDLAAMGDVKPLATLVTVALPGNTPVDFANQFYQGLRQNAQRWKIGFLGGDTVGSRRDMVVSATVFGEADPKRLIQRGTAQEGDIVASVGPLGLAAGGLEVLQKKKKGWSWTAPLVDAFLRPQPQFAAGALLARQGWATSLIDASDGLEASVLHLAEDSRLGVALDLNSVRVHPALQRWALAQKKEPGSYVLNGGEDYALVFTVAAKDWPRTQKALPTARAMGRMVSRREGRFALHGKKKIPITRFGYAHFKS